MAVSYIAARPINLAGTHYNAGDPVTTTGWDPNVLSTMIRMGWIEVSVGGSSQTHTAGTLANLPANGSQPDGSTYLATDQNGGTPYLMVAGTWVQESAGVSQATGTVAGPVQLGAAFSVLAVGTTWTDVPLMSINVPASSRPVMIRFKCEAVITTGTAAANSSARIWLALTTAAGVLVELGEFGTYVSGTSYQIAGHIAIEHYLAAPVTAATYKLQARMQAATAGLTTASLTPSNGLVGGAQDNLVAVAG